jgi:flagellar hook-associated protein 2
MSRLQGLYRNGIRLSDGSSLSFSEIGISVQRDGKLLLSDGDFADAITNGLQSKLAQGVTLGYESPSVNFVKYLTDSLKSDGILTSRVDAVEDEQTRLQDKISELEDKMSVLETRYYKQYAALDGLLMRLQATQSALSSALAGLESTRNNK